MKVIIKGGNTVNLSKNDFIAKGGEGEIYGKENTIYKIYLNPKRMIPQGKILELQKLKIKNILSPQEVLLNKNKAPIGFTMDWVKNTVSLCKLFTNDFRNRNNITINSTIELIEAIKNSIEEVHLLKYLIVDINELNFLVDDTKYINPFLIDVDSYQTQNYPATAIMPYIRDYQTKAFTEFSDWYSFAILCCQLFIGIHPFKGKHPDYSKKDLLQRMKENASIFNAKVSLPSAVRDFSCIPSNYLNWFIDLFEKGNRGCPPIAGGVIKTAKVKIVILKSTDVFEIKLLKEIDGIILYFRKMENDFLLKTKSEIYFYQGNRKYQYGILKDEEVLYCNELLLRSDPFIFVSIKNNKLILKCQGQNIRTIDITCAEKLIIDNVLFLRNKDKLIEIGIKVVGQIICPYIKNTWDIMLNSSILFSGMVFQSVLGKPYFVIPQPQLDKRSSCFVKHIPELEGYKIIEAKHENKVCMLKVFKDNEYSKVIIVFDSDYKKYLYRINNGIIDPIINFTVLENDVVVSIEEDGLMEIFSSRINLHKVKRINNNNLKSTMKLYKDGISVCFTINSKLYNIKMK